MAQNPERKKRLQEIADRRRARSNNARLVSTESRINDPNRPALSRRQADAARASAVGLSYDTYVNQQAKATRNQRDAAATGLTRRAAYKDAGTRRYDAQTNRDEMAGTRGARNQLMGSQSAVNTSVAGVNQANAANTQTQTAGLARDINAVTDEQRRLNYSLPVTREQNRYEIDRGNLGIQQQRTAQAGRVIDNTIRNQDLPESQRELIGVVKQGYHSMNPQTDPLVDAMAINQRIIQPQQQAQPQTQPNMVAPAPPQRVNSAPMVTQPQQQPPNTPAPQQQVSQPQQLSYQDTFNNITSVLSIHPWERDNLKAQVEQLIDNPAIMNDVINNGFAEPDGYLSRSPIWNRLSVEQRKSLLASALRERRELLLGLAQNF